MTETFVAKPGSLSDGERMVVAVGELGAWIARKAHDNAEQPHTLGILLVAWFVSGTGIATARRWR